MKTFCFGLMLVPWALCGPVHAMTPMSTEFIQCDDDFKPNLTQDEENAQASCTKGSKSNQKACLAKFRRDNQAEYRRMAGDAARCKDESAESINQIG